MKEGEYLDAKCLRQRNGERASHNECYKKRAKIQKSETLYDLLMLFLKVTSTCTKIPELDKIPQGRPQKTPEQYRLFHLVPTRTRQEPTAEDTRHLGCKI